MFRCPWSVIMAFPGHFKLYRWAAHPLRTCKTNGIVLVLFVWFKKPNAVEEDFLKTD